MVAFSPRAVGLVSSFLFGIASVACRDWTVVQQAKPNPLPRATGFVVLPFEFVGMKVTEQQRELLEKGFGYGLRLEAQGDVKFKTPDQATPSDVVIQTQFELVDGESTYEVDHSDAEVIVTVSLLYGDTVVDQVQKSTELGLSGNWAGQTTNRLGWLSDQQQLSGRGEELGDELADYLQERTR